MKKITTLLLFTLPFLCLGQSYYYNFDTAGDLEGFTQGGIPSLDVTGGALVASDSPTAYAGGFQQIRTPDGLGLVEGDYTIVRIVAENLLTETATPGNHELFRIVNYTIGNNSPGGGAQSGNITIPYGAGFNTYDFAIPTNSSNGGVLDRIGLRVQLASGSGLAGTFTIDQFIIVNTLTVDIATNGDFENNGGELAPWVANGPDVSASLTAGNGGGSAGRLTFDQNATSTNTLRNSFFTFSPTELEQVSTVTVNFDAKSSTTPTGPSPATVGVQISHSLGGGSLVTQFNGNETLTTSWASYSVNRSLSADFDEIRVDLRVKTNAANASLGDTFDFDNVSVLVDYYDLTPAGPAGIASAQAGNWNDTTTWAGGVIPVATDNVIIDHTVTVNNDVGANDLTISSGQQLLVNKGNSVTVEGDLVTDAAVNNSFILRADSDQFSSLIVKGTSTGDIRFRRYVNDTEAVGGNDLISPPVHISSFNDFYSDNATLFTEDPNSDDVLFGPFDNSAIVNAYVNFESTDTNALVQGKGYRMGTNGTLAETSALNFHGTVETGNVDATLTNEVGGSPWNLIGNPYTSYISFKDFFDGLADYDGTTVGPNNQLDASFTAIYGYDGDNGDGSIWTIWDFNNTDYATDLITPGQGFFVRSKTGGGTASFTPAMQTIGTTDDFIAGRSATTSNFALIGLRLNSANESYITNVYFRDYNSLGLDPGFDTGAYSQSALGIFTNLVEENNGVLLANQSLPYGELNNIEIPLVVNSNEGVQISFSLDAITDLPVGINVYLDDSFLNTSTLLNTGDYIMTPNTTLNGSGRFYLRLTSNALSLYENQLEGITIYNVKKTLTIKGQLARDTNANVFDMQCRLVSSESLNTTVNNQTIDLSHLVEGVYVVLLDGDNQQKTKKIVLSN